MNSVLGKLEVAAALALLAASCAPPVTVDAGSSGGEDAGVEVEVGADAGGHDAGPPPTSNLDPTFGDGGCTWIHFGGSDESIEQLAIMEDGRIVAAGTAGSIDGGPPAVGVARLLASGAHDLAFGASGVVRIGPMPQVRQFVRAVLPTDSGVVLGLFRDSWLTLAKVTTAGHLDVSYGDGGFVRTDALADLPEVVSPLISDGDGVLVGYRLPLGSDFVLTRFDASGAGGAPVVVRGLGLASDLELDQLARASDGGWLIAGRSSLRGLVVGKVLPDGGGDETFSSGSSTITLAPHNSQSRSISALVEMDDGSLRVLWSSSALTYLSGTRQGRVDSRLTADGGAVLLPGTVTAALEHSPGVLALATGFTDPTSPELAVSPAARLVLLDGGVDLGSPNVGHLVAYLPLGHHGLAKAIAKQGPKLLLGGRTCSVDGTCLGVVCRVTPLPEAITPLRPHRPRR